MHVRAGVVKPVLAAASEVLLVATEVLTELVVAALVVAALVVAALVAAALVVAPSVAASVVSSATVVDSAAVVVAVAAAADEVFGGTVGCVPLVTPDVAAAVEAETVASEVLTVEADCVSDASAVVVEATDVVPAFPAVVAACAVLLSPPSVFGEPLAEAAMVEAVTVAEVTMLESVAVLTTDDSESSDVEAAVVAARVDVLTAFELKPAAAGLCVAPEVVDDAVAAAATEAEEVNVATLVEIASIDVVTRAVEVERAEADETAA